MKPIAVTLYIIVACLFSVLKSGERGGFFEVIDSLKMPRRSDYYFIYKNKRYDSISEAADAACVSPTTFNQRCRSSNFLNFKKINRYNDQEVNRTKRRSKSGKPKDGDTIYIDADSMSVAEKRAFNDKLNREIPMSR